MDKAYEHRTCNRRPKGKSKANTVRQRVFHPWYQRSDKPYANREHISTLASPNARVAR